MSLSKTCQNYFIVRCLSLINLLKIVDTNCFLSQDFVVDKDGNPTELTQRAHDRGLKVHAWTFRFVVFQ